MKFTIILFVVVGVALAKETFKLSQPIIDKINEYGKPCADKYNVDHSMIRRVADGTLPRDDATNNFFLCFTVSAGYMTEDGHLVVDKLANLIKDHPLVEEFKESIKKCNEVTKENPIATAVAMNQCFAEDTPIRFLF